MLRNVLVIALGLAFTSGHAAIVQYQWSGETLTENLAALPGVPAGTPYTYAVLFDSEAEDVASQPEIWRTFEVQGAFQIASYNLPIDETNSGRTVAQVWKDFPTGPSERITSTIDGMTLIGPPFDTGQALFDIVLSVVNTGAPLFSVPEPLQTIGLTREDFTRGSIFIHFLNPPGSPIVSPLEGSVTAFSSSIVPIPAAAWLFPAGLVAGLGWMRRKSSYPG